MIIIHIHMVDREKHSFILFRTPRRVPLVAFSSTKKLRESLFYDDRHQLHESMNIDIQFASQTFLLRLDITRSHHNTSRRREIAF